MKVFLSYKFTGENKNDLVSYITKVEDAFKLRNVNVYSTIHDSDQFANENWSGKQILNKAFKEIDSSEILLFIVRKEEISQGMLVELGYSLHTDKRLVLFINKNIGPSIYKRQIEEQYEFTDIESLLRIISELKL
jgi:nucleoside 2-deoxyribosyltransferase